MTERAPIRMIEEVIERHPAIVALAHMLFDEDARLHAAIHLDAEDFPNARSAQLFDLLRTSEAATTEELIDGVRSSAPELLGILYGAAGVSVETLLAHPIEWIAEVLEDYRPRHRRSTAEIRAELAEAAA